MRCQFVLDKTTNGLLDDLASARAGNRSFVVREAIQFYASMESALEEAEEDSGFQEMMSRSAADIRAGRVFSPADAKRRLLRAKRKK